MPYSDLVTQKEAAAILNRSVSAVSRAIKDGRLEYADPNNRLLHRPGLEMRFARKTRPRIDKPQVKSANPAGTKWRPATLKSPEPEPIAEDYWGRLLQKLLNRHGWCAGLLEPGAKRTSADAVLSDDRRAAATVRAGGV